MNEAFYRNLDKQKLLKILTGICNCDFVLSKKDDDYVTVELQIKEIRYLRDLLKEVLL